MKLPSEQYQSLDSESNALPIHHGGLQIQHQTNLLPCFEMICNTLFVTFTWHLAKSVYPGIKRAGRGLFRLVCVLLATLRVSLLTGEPEAGIFCVIIKNYPSLM